MSAAAPIKSDSYRKAFMLICIYAMHLMFFQVLLQAEPSNIDNSFKPLFHHSHNNTQKPKHPALTYYIMTVKQATEAGVSCDNITPAVHQLYVVVTPQVVSVFFSISQISIRQFHIADDAFKVYRLIQVFLI